MNAIFCTFSKKKDGTYAISNSLIKFGQSYKPGSVLDDHLSRLAIADKLQRPTYREVTGSHPWSLFGLAPDGVYTAGMSPYRR